MAGGTLLLTVRVEGRWLCLAVEDQHHGNFALHSNLVPDRTSGCQGPDLVESLTQVGDESN